MKDDVRAVDSAKQRVVVGTHVCPDDCQSARRRRLLQPFGIRFRSSAAEVIQNRHARARKQIVLGGVGANEACPSGDDDPIDAHRRLHSIHQSHVARGR